MKQFIMMLIISVGLPFFSTAQLMETKNGHNLTPRGTVKVLLVFAESVGSCAGTVGDVSWPAGTGITATSPAPPNADMYLDYNTTDPNYPLTSLTQYYYDMSLGEYNVIGDYYEHTVQVPCSVGTSETAVIAQLNQDWQPDVSGDYLTANGLNFNEFDNYQSSHGGLKLPGYPDNKVDVVVILWRNSPSWLNCQGGWGIGNIMSANNLLGKQVGLYGAWDFCPSKLNTGYDGFFVAEYFHALFGGNHFHSGSGAGAGTTVFGNSPSFSTTAQGASVSNVVCGWDRWFLDWKGTGSNARNFSISATDPTSGLEVASDLESSSAPNSVEYVLQDFVTVGDAVRIKLPHFNWEDPGDKKNQYLWIENHQGINEFDHNKGETWQINNGCPSESWEPGLHSYIQIGKDELAGNAIYSANEQNPNGLKDWLFPKTAEGSWDYYYSYADQNYSQWGPTCLWDNGSVPFSIYDPNGNSFPNPFTGYFDGFGFLDTDNNGIIEYSKSSKDKWQPSWQKWTGNATPGTLPPINMPKTGDSKDAFTANSPYQKISISTNPSSTPVYTLKERSNSPQSYDNRTIHLNNVSIEILNHNYYNVGPADAKSLHIRVRWDDGLIDNNTRWCGNVALENDPLRPSQKMKIEVASNRTICVDKGRSPMYVYETAPGDFTDPSYLHLAAGTAMKLNSPTLKEPSLKVINGSTLHIKSGANVDIQPKASILIDANSHICIESGAVIKFRDPDDSRIIIEDQSGNLNAHAWDHDIVDIAMNENYFAFNTITTSGTITGTSLINSSAPEDILLQAGKSITFKPNTTIEVIASEQFSAVIKDPNNCQDPNINNYRPAMVTNTGAADPTITLEEEQLNNAPNATASPKTEPNVTKVLSVFPNPTSNRIHLQVSSSNLSNASLAIYDLHGKLVQTIAEGQLTSAIYTYDFKNQPAGVYAIQLITSERVYTQKVVLTR